MRVVAALVFGLALTCHTPALAQTAAPAPVPIEEWSLAKISAMGEEIQRQDVAAWVATDALFAAYSGAPPPALAGWIVVPDGDDQRVRFMTRESGTIRPGWDVVVRIGQAGAVETVEGQDLTEEEQARFRARQTAIANIGALHCSPRMNSVVADDPDSDGWLVWLLTSSDDVNVVPMGGHYRFTISADGRSLVRRDQLSNSCVSVQNNGAPTGGRTTNLFVTHIVSQTPVETHVFLSLQNRLPIFVGVGDKIYEVNGADIRDVPR